MTKEQFDAWIAAQGGPDAVQYGFEDVMVDNPAKDADAISRNNPNIPAKISKRVQQWVNKKTGALLQATPGDAPGDLIVVKQVDAAPTAADPAKPPTERVNPADPTKRQVWNPEANGGKGAWEDGGAVAGDASKPPTERVNPSDPKRRQRWDPAANGGKGEWVDAGDIAKPSDPSKPPQERPNPEDPTRRQRWDPDANGGAGAWVDSGTIAKPAEKPTIKDIDGVPHQLVETPDGPVYKPVKVEGQAGADPAFVGSMPTYIPQQIADDLTAYSLELNAAVNAKAITPARATELMNARHTAALTALKVEQDAAQSIYSGGIQQRGQDITQANAALGESGANFRQSLTTAAGINGWVDQGSDAGYRLFNYLRQQGQADARAYGGLDKPATIPVPAAIERNANITVKAPDGTVVTVPSGGGAAPAADVPVPAAPVEMPAPVPSIHDPNAPVPGVMPEQQAMLLNPQSTGYAAIDAQGETLAAQHRRPPMTFESMEEKFRSLGMSEDSILASRANFRGAA